ncbi:MAG: hypothetical protein QHG94_08300 [Candidatus Methanosuratincola sp.]|nr:hypothetical protein [Candidatus Methanosuratincola sp.]
MKESKEQISPAPSSAKRSDNGLFQGVERIGSEVGQIPVLGAAPEAFHGVEIRGVRRQPFDIDPVALAQPGLDLL